MYVCPAPMIGSPRAGPSEALESDTQVLESVCPLVSRRTVWVPSSPFPKEKRKVPTTPTSTPVPTPAISLWPWKPKLVNQEVSMAGRAVSQNTLSPRNSFNHLCSLLWALAGWLLWASCVGEGRRRKGIMAFLAGHPLCRAHSSPAEPLHHHQPPASATATTQTMRARPLTLSALRPSAQGESESISR